MKNKKPEIDPDIAFNHVRRMLGDISPNFAFVVMDEDGDLFYDYTNYRIGRMLMTEALDDMDSDFGDFDWDNSIEDVEDEDDDDEDYIF